MARNTYGGHATQDHAAAGTVTERQWQAIIGNDAACDGHFFYAVRTTGIFCRPSCKSRPPRREHVVIFRTADEALAARFRPCKRCRPDGLRLPDEEWIAGIAAYIDNHYMESLTLEKLAEIHHGSPYHLQRTFKRVTGITPTGYLQTVRIARAKRLLAETGDGIAEVGSRVGLRNTPYFITLFKQMEGLTPAEYRRSYGRNGEETSS